MMTTIFLFETITSTGAPSGVPFPYLREPMRTEHKNIEELINTCHAIAKEKGWWDGSNEKLTVPEIAEKLLMIHAEVSEATEALRIHEIEISTYDNKPEGMTVELADVMIRIFDLAGRMDLKLVEAIDAKIKYNRTRSHRHGGKAL